MKDSPLAIDEADEHNNRGTFYDVQFISYAIFVDRQDLAKSQIEVTKKEWKIRLKPMEVSLTN